MNPNLLRGSLYGVGASLWIWALAAAFITPWYWLLLIVGAVLIMAGGCVPRVDEPDDDWFNPEHRPVWPNDAGSPE